MAFDEKMLSVLSIKRKIFSLFVFYYAYILRTDRRLEISFLILTYFFITGPFLFSDHAERGRSTRRLNPAKDPIDKEHFYGKLNYNRTYYSHIASIQCDLEFKLPHT